MKNYFFLFAILFSIISFSQDSEVNRELQKMVYNKSLSQRDIGFKVTDYSESKLSKVQFIYYRQEFNGTEIIGTESNLSLTQNGKVLINRNNFVRDLQDKIISTSRTNTPESILGKLATEMNYRFTKTINRISTEENVTYLSDGGISERVIPVKEIFYAEKYGKVKVAWEISIKETESNDWWNFIVDDATGEIIRKANWTVECAFGENHNHSDTNHNHINFPTSINANTSNFADDNASYNVFAFPIESPLYGSRTIEQGPHDISASPLGWHDTNGIAGADHTVTRGNNVNAYEDGDNFGYQPNGGPTLTFDYNLNPVYSIADQSEDAAITNLFYWTNIAHDITYRYGFDEGSGNFQELNYSGLGLGGDQVNAEAQDNSGSCNANFSSPPDGIPGTMQMYTCNSRDGSFDNNVIVHEFGHGISIRLTGGPSISDCLFNDEQMGEGWSDWYGLMLTMTSGDMGTDIRPVGNWLFEQDITGPGVRDYPYSTDMTVDPRTYDFIKTTFGPHPLGSTWAAMLWELTWGLIDQHGFDPDFYTGTGGNNIALALVTEALKLQPCNPGFVDGRDAIILADQVLYGGQNECIIWEAFAKRGLGFSASQGSSFDRTDGIEAFDLPNTSITTPDTEFCQTDSSIILNGGVPSGGVYSGPGVTDNGDGLTYTFDPAAAGVGTHTITYSAVSTCSPSGTATDTITVKDENPIIECTDITIELDDNDSATILPQDVVLGYEPGGGYTLETNGTFNPEDISLVGNSIFLGDDQVSTDLPVGFDFSFFGNQYNTFRISSNGFITFNDSFDSGCCSGQALPNTSSPNNLIALGWTDLNPSNGGSINYTTLGSAPNRILVVDFTNIPLFGSGSIGVTAQVKMFESTGVIEIHSTVVNGFSMLQGIENVDGSAFGTIPGRNSQNFNITNDYVSFVPTVGQFPDNCGLETTVTLDLDTFDCNNLGDNLVTATVTDTSGNSSTCVATVTVLPNDDINFIPSETVFCEDLGVQNNLSGGIPTGGVYSGLGVTDDGNGSTFSLDPAVAGVGFHDISYTVSNSCGSSTIVDSQVEVLPGIPQIECQDITVELDANGTATLLPENLVLGGSTSSLLYTLGNNFSPTNNVYKYDYDNDNDDLIIDNNYIGSTQFNSNFALDYNKSDGLVYTLNGSSSSSSRDLYSFDLTNNTSSFISSITSISGNTNPQAMAIGSDGTFYFAFQSGEINAFDIQSLTMSPLGIVSPNGAVGLTYDFDSDRLLYTTGTSLIELVEIDINSGSSSLLFTFNGLSGCAAQASEYVGNGKLLLSSTLGCNKIYSLDINSQLTQIILDPVGNYDNVKDIMLVSSIPSDNCNGEALTFSIDQDTFDCNDLGDNTVILTATDNQGNTSTCSATVSVVPNDDIDLILTETLFCEDLGVITNLGGGAPIGGVYSGLGVTDDGNGSTFSFDPTATGIGFHDVTYTINNACSSLSTTEQIEVIPGIPQINCQDISVELEANGTVTIQPEDLILGGSASGSLYALGDIFNSTNNIYRYDYDGDVDNIVLDSSFIGSTQFDRNYALDYNKSNGLVYGLFAISQSDPRNLYSFDLTDNSSQLIENISSVNGNNNPQAMAIGDDGTFYFAFQSGEINAYDVQTQTMSPLGNVTQNGAVGLSYDSENDRLLYTTGQFTIDLVEIDINTGNSSLLFSFTGPTDCAAQSTLYLGNDILLVSSAASACDKLYTVNLSTQQVEIVLDPIGNFIFIKDLMLIDNLPIDNCTGEALTFTLDQDTFDCNDLGDNNVIVTATDSQGNTSTCSATVTVVPNDDIELVLTETIFCEDLGVITNIGGGTPTGGVYSGLGVTDDGNGSTFSFDPAVAGVGFHDVTYTINNACSSLSITEQIEVIPGIPQIECQDISVELEANGTVTILPEDILLGSSSSGTLYVLGNNFSPTNNIYKYDYNPDNDTYTLDNNYIGSTQFNSNFALDYNKSDGLMYSLNAFSSGSSRDLYNFDVTNNNSSFIASIVSVNGNTKPQAMAVDNNGTFYFAFQSGEINTFDLQTQTMSPLADLNLSGANGAVGLTYDFDNDRLLYTSGTSNPELIEIDVNSGANSFLFSFSSPAGCSAQASEYIGNGKMLLSSTFGCNTIYSLDINSQTTQIVLDPVGNYDNLKDLTFINNTPTDNCSGEALTFSIDQDTFDCNDLGDNTVTLTATDSQGNTSTCTATVTIAPNNDVIELNLTEDLFCEDLGVQTNLGGGIPAGGVYSGIGVTDDGNGSTFSFDPAVAGIGFNDVTYTVSNSCGSSSSAVSQIEVISGIPQIQCQDISVELEVDGTVTILPEDILLGNSSTATFYALGNIFSSINNIYKFEFDADNDNLILDNNYLGSTQFNNNFALDYNKSNGMVYGLFASSSSAPRQLYSFDLNNNSSQFIGSIVSSTGNTRPQAMAIDESGTFYFAFQSGEINAYDLQTQTMSPLSSVNAAGSVGLAFDGDNQRLLYTTDTFNMDLIEIDINSGASNFLFTFSSPNGCNAQAIEYVGNGKIYVSSTGGCDSIYSLDINSQQTSIILDPVGNFDNIKDLMLINNIPTDNCTGEALTFSVDQDTFDCNDVGVNTVVLTATDSQGNTSTCTATVTVVENNSGELLDCVDSFTVALDNLGNASIDYTDLINNPTSTGSCGDVITYTLSQDTFDCSDYTTSSPIEVITNGSFENDLTNWVTNIENGTDQGPGDCQQGWKKLADSSTICCCVSEIFPTDGNFGAFTSFDGIANISYVLEQTFLVPSAGNFNANLSFDWVGEFNISGAAMAPRTLAVDLYDNSDNLISNVYTEDIPIGTNSSINQSLSFDVSNTLELYQNQNVTLRFRAIIPEGFTGPSKAMIDNVSLLVDSSFIDVQITATSDSGTTDTCNVQVFITDPTDACGLSNTNFDFTNNFSFYPNPSSQRITMNWSNMTLEYVEIFDINGRLVVKKNINQGLSEMDIDLSELSSGVYILKATSNFGSVARKLIKE